MPPKRTFPGPKPLAAAAVAAPEADFFAAHADSAHIAPPPPPSGASVDLVAGHRARLRARFDRGETLADYELLELLLFRPIPRRDTKPIAKAMIARFGSFAATIAAPAARLGEIEGVGERVASDFRLVRAAAERLAAGALPEREALSSTDAVAHYYRAKLTGLPREEFHILFLDKKNRVLGSECAGVGTVDHAPVYPREVVTRSLALGASAIVLVHNHPSGDPTPSRADIAVTRTIEEALAPVGIQVHDHIIIAGTRHLSLRGDGYF
ncbi:MAG: DNA repair protein RadC [Acuticoccus sp.]